MGTKSAKRTINLNLSERYVADWNSWSVAREVISNAMDADRAWMSVESDGPNQLTVTTKTIPTLEELTVIGGGTKSADSQTIGQFGEGFKLAALTTIRLGGNITVNLPRMTLAFGLTQQSGHLHRTLEAHILPSTNEVEECRITIMLPGVGEYRKRFLRDTDTTRLPRPQGGTGELYNKGVYVCQLPTNALFSWNISTKAINRDRSMIDEYARNWAIGAQMSTQLTRRDVELIDAMMDTPDAMEWRAAGDYSAIGYLGQATKEWILGRFHQKFGKNAILGCTDHRMNDLATHLGFKPILLPEVFEKMLPDSEGSRSTIKQVIPKDHDLVPIPIEKYEDEVLELYSLVEMLELPVEVRIFDVDKADKSLLGRCREENNTLVVWLSSKLFARGQRPQRIDTLIHELGHVKGGGDCSHRFEDSLTNLGGRLARLLLDAKGK